MSSRIRPAARIAAALAAVSVGALLTSCAGSPDAPATFDPDEPVTITVGDRPSEEQTDARNLFEQKVQEFEALYPNVTIEESDTAWNPQTYQAMLAGGTMPTTLRVPLTEIQQLAANGQVADITDVVAGDPVASSLNPALVEDASRDGRVYGLPTGGYTMAFVYSRALYEEAGLDPDTPPASWDEVQANAKAIHDATGTTGFVMPTKDNGGGWMLTALNYAFGSQLEDTSTDPVTATLDTDAMRGALQFLHDVRWKDDAFGSNFLLATSDIATGLAAGDIAQAMMPGDTYAWYAYLGMPVEDIGFAALPQQPGGLGTLAGGNISVVNPDATPAEAAAAIKWIDYYYLSKYTDEDAAVADAKATADNGVVVGAPEMSLFDEQAQQTYLGFIKDYIDVPRENFQGYIDSLSTLPLVPEPKEQAQQIYAMLDATVQAVLTDENADIDELVTQAQAQAADLIAAG